MKLFVGIVAVIVIIICVIAGLVVLGFDITGFISSDDDGDSDQLNPGNVDVNADGYRNLGLSKQDIHIIISLLTNTSPPYAEHSIFIEGLHMQVWGLDGTTAYYVLQDYERKNLNDDFISYTSGAKHGIGWTAYAEVWYNDIGMARGIVVGDGSYIKSAYGYDVVLMTSYGPVLDYYDYVSFLSRY